MTLTGHFATFLPVLTRVIDVYGIDTVRGRRCSLVCAVLTAVLALLPWGRAFPFSSVKIHSTISRGAFERLVLPIVLVLCLGWVLACVPGDTKVEELAPGVVYHKIHLLEGPWWIHVIELDLPKAWAAGIRLRTAMAHSERSGVQKTSVLAAGSLAAINGDFLYTSKTSYTSGLQIHNGSLIRTPQRQSAFAISAAGEPLIAVYQMELGVLTAAGEDLRAQGFNREPSSGELVVYNHHAQVWHDSVRAARGFLLQGLGGDSIINDIVYARVQQVRRRAWPLFLEPGQWLLAAGAEYGAAAAIAPGDTVRLYCRLLPARDKLVEAIGGGPRILRDGAISIEVEKERLSRASADERHPRTGIGYSQNGQVLFLIAVDGRQPGYSVGMSLQELAEFMRTRLADFSLAKENAYQGLNLDGGGSTTMVVAEEVVNSPSDPTGERPVANALLVIAPTNKEDTP